MHRRLMLPPRLLYPLTIHLLVQRFTTPLTYHPCPAIPFIPYSIPFMAKVSETARRHQGKLIRAIFIGCNKASLVVTDAHPPNGPLTGAWGQNPLLSLYHLPFSPSASLFLFLLTQSSLTCLSSYFSCISSQVTRYPDYRLSLLSLYT